LLRNHSQKEDTIIKLKSKVQKRKPDIPSSSLLEINYLVELPFVDSWFITYHKSLQIFGNLIIYLKFIYNYNRWGPLGKSTKNIFHLHYRNYDIINMDYHHWACYQINLSLEISLAWNMWGYGICFHMVIFSLHSMALKFLQFNTHEKT